MSFRRVVIFLLLVLGSIVAISFAVWYFVQPEIQFFIYWIIGICVAVLLCLAAIVQITGYSLRDLLTNNDPQVALHEHNENITEQKLGKPKDALTDILQINPENNGHPHEAGPGQWFSRLRIESNQEVNKCLALIYSIHRLGGPSDIEGAPLPRSTESQLSWARGKGSFTPIDIKPGSSEFLDIAWRADDPPIPKNELRISSSLDPGERDKSKFGSRQDFIPLEPGHYKLVVRIIAEGFDLPIELAYHLHWPGPGLEKSISLTDITRE